MWDKEWKRSCATCMHHTSIGARLPSACAGCIKGGTLTRWEGLRLPAGQAPSATREELIHKSTA